MWAEVLWSLTSVVKRIRILFGTQIIFVNSNFCYSPVQWEVDYFPHKQRDSWGRSFSRWFAGIPLPELWNWPRGTPASQKDSMAFQLPDRPSTKQEVCCVFFLPTSPPPPLIVWPSSSPSLAMYFCNKSSKRHQTQPHATSDVQGVSAKAWGTHSCRASFWKGRTGTRAGLQ